MENRITGTTRLIGLFGTPIKHSQSPEMYNYCFKREGIDMAYLTFETDKTTIEDALKTVRLFDMRGCNVTMPCKSLASELVDEISPVAKVMGAVNTIIHEDGKLKGYNTDGMGLSEV